MDPSGEIQSDNSHDNSKVTNIRKQIQMAHEMLIKIVIHDKNFRPHINKYKYDTNTYTY